jgi:hypothetical protein
MGEQASKPPRWVRVEVNVTMRLPDADAQHPSYTSRTYELTSAAGEEIGTAVAVVDAPRRLVAVREIRYDADKATEAEARQALERVLSRLRIADR